MTGREPRDATCELAEGHTGWLNCPVHGAEIRALLAEGARYRNDESVRTALKRHEERERGA